MAKVTISPSPDQFGKNLQEKAEKATHYALWMTANRVVSIIQNELIPSANPQPVDRGMYRAGWKAALIEKGAEVTNSLPYASIIEYGARAENIKIGRKMLDALAEWAQRKGIAEDDVEAGQIAWAIARSMQKRGIFNGGTGLRILEKAMARVPDIFREEMAKALKKVGAA